MVSVMGWMRENDGVVRFSIAILLVIGIMVVPMSAADSGSSADQGMAEEKSLVAPDHLERAGYFVDRSLEAMVLGEPMYTVAVWLHTGNASGLMWGNEGEQWYDRLEHIASLDHSVIIEPAGLNRGDGPWKESGTTWYLYSNSSEIATISLPSPAEREVMELSVGGESRRFEWTTGEHSWDVMLNEGLNRIDVGPVECSGNKSCGRFSGALSISTASLLDPADVEYVADTGKAVATGNISLLDHDTGLYDWEGEDPSYRWLKDEKTVDVVADEQGWVKIDLKAKAFLDGRLGVSLGDSAAVVSFSPNTFESEELWFKLDEGRNEFELTSLDCLRPGEVTAGSKDARCLAVALANATLHSRSSLPTDNRFMPQSSTMQVSERVNHGWNNIDVQSVSTPIRSINTSVSVSPTVSVTMENTTLLNYRGYGAGGPLVLANSSKVVPFGFTESLVCVEKDKEVSCSQAEMQGQRVVSEGNSLNLLTFRHGFYDWEELDGRPFTWLRRPLQMDMFVKDDVSIDAHLNATVFERNSGVLTVGGNEVDVNGSAVNTSFELDKGRQRVAVEPDRCTFPATVIEGSTDWRCLSIGFFDMELQLDS